MDVFQSVHIVQKGAPTPPGLEAESGDLCGRRRGGRAAVFPCLSNSLKMWIVFAHLPTTLYHWIE